MVASSELFRSRQVQAMSVSTSSCPFHNGVGHSAGQPDHADGDRIDRGDGAPGPSSINRTPFGSPGTAVVGPTVPGGCVAGSFALGVSSKLFAGRSHAARSSTAARDFLTVTERYTLVANTLIAAATS